MQWIVSQIGAREHYAVPRALHRRGHLDLFVTDAWCRWGSGLLRRGPALLRRFAGRHHPDLPSHKVRAFTLASIRNDRRLKAEARSNEGWTRANLEIGAWFARRVNRVIRGRRMNPAVTAFFGFQTASLETIQLLSQRGVFTVLDQAGPGRVEEDLVRQEAEKWPGWERMTGLTPEVYFERLAAEWSAVSAILVNSEWSRECLIRQGAEAGKIFVVPLAYEAPPAPPRPPRQGHGPLTVMWLGQVILRKGIQYLVEAARELQVRDIRVVVVGPVNISAEAAASAPSNVTFTGRVTRDRAVAMYREADVFVLPTISDGFAITQIEAMAQGLPVIATPRCGNVVTQGVDGLIVPAGESVGLARAIARLDDDRDLLRSMSAAALLKSRQFTLDHYAERLEREVAKRRAAENRIA
jgi:glycosyltransferase involved in cell wall biosynthesis